MKTLRPFIKGHIKEVLQTYEGISQKRNSEGLRRLPFDSYLRNYYKTYKTLGPSERSVISETLYKYLRNDLLLEFLTRQNKGIDSKIELMTQWDKVEMAIQNQNIPMNIRCSCPQELFQIVAKDYGEHTAYDFFLSSNSKAPLTLRVNPIKITREEFLNRWRYKDRDLLFKKTEFSPYGIVLTGPKQTSLQDTDDFRDGLFEIQDEASQLCALRVKCQPKDKVLDYCAGSGGKSLAFAHQMEGTGQIVLHDVREDMLEKAKKRCNRAGVQNILLTTDYRKLKGFKYDWIMLDVPCTGIGTLRRNPDMKLYFNRNHLDELVELQQEIFDKAIKLLKKDGKIVYVTCSILKEENHEQISRFCNMYNMKIHGDGVFQSLPKKGGMDSFFSATLEFN